MLDAHTAGKRGTVGGGRDAANRVSSPPLSPSNEHARVSGNKRKEFAISRNLGLSPHTLAVFPRGEIGRDFSANEAPAPTSHVAGVARPVCDANDTTCDSVSTMASHEDYVSMALTFFSAHASPKKEKTGSLGGAMHSKIEGRIGLSRRRQGPDRDAVSVEQRGKRTHEVMQRRQSIPADLLSRHKGPRGMYTSHQATLGAHGGGSRRDKKNRDEGVVLPSLSAVQTGTRPTRTAAKKEYLPRLPDIRAGRKDGQHGAGGEGVGQGDMVVSNRPVRLHGHTHLERSESPQGHPTLGDDRSGVWEEVPEIYERGGWEEERDDESVFERGAADTYGEESVENAAEPSFKPYEPERPGGPNDEEGGGGGGTAAEDGGRASGRMREEGSDPRDAQGRSVRQERRVSHAAAHAAAAAASAAAAAAAAAAEAAVAVVGPRAYSSDC